MYAINRVLVLDPNYFTSDGGGIRGLSSLLILKAVMVEVARLDQEHRFHHDQSAGNEAVALPCHYFDHIVGTSTGGWVQRVIYSFWSLRVNRRLIALMLGRLRMSIQDVIKVYLRFGDNVFGHPRRFSRNRFDEKRFEKIIKDVLKDRYADNVRGGEEEPMEQFDHGEQYERICMTFVSL